MKKGLTKLGRFLNCLGIYTFRVEKIKVLPECKVLVTWNEGLNLKNPLTWLAIPILGFIAILDEGITGLVGLTTRVTFAKRMNWSDL